MNLAGLREVLVEYRTKVDGEYSEEYDSVLKIVDPDSDELADLLVIIYKEKREDYREAGDFNKEIIIEKGLSLGFTPNQTRYLISHSYLEDKLEFIDMSLDCLTAENYQEILKDILFFSDTIASLRKITFPNYNFPKKERPTGLSKAVEKGLKYHMNQSRGRRGHGDIFSQYLEKMFDIFMEENSRAPKTVELYKELCVGDTGFKKLIIQEKEEDGIKVCWLHNGKENTTGKSNFYERIKKIRKK